MQYNFSSLPVEMRLKRIFNNYSWSPNGLLVKIDSEAMRERNNCFSKIQLFGQKYRE